VLYSFGGLLLFSLVAIAGVLVLLHTDYGRNLVRERLEEELSAVFVGEVRVGGVHGSLLSKFTLRDITIKDAQGQVAVEVGAVEVEYSLSQLVDTTVMVDSLLLENLRVQGVRNEDGTINLAQLIKTSDDTDDEDDEPSSDSAPSSWRVIASKIALRSSSASFRDGLQTSQALELSLDASVRFEAGTLTADLASLTGNVLPPANQAEVGPSKLALPLSVRGTLESGSEGLAVQSLQASLGDAVISLPSLVLKGDGQTKADASITMPASMVRIIDPASALLADVQLSIHAERSDVSQPIALQAKGTLGTSPVDLVGTLSLEQESLDMQLNAQAINGAALWMGAVSSQVNLTVEAKATGLSMDSAQATVIASIGGTVDKAELGDLRIDASLGKGVASVNVAPTTGPAWIKASAKVRLADLEILKSELHLNHSRVQSLVHGYSDARGDLTVDATASGPLTAIEVEGTVASKRFSTMGNRVRGLSASWQGVVGGGTYAGSAELKASSITSAGTPYGSATLNVHTLKPNTFKVHLVSRGPKRSHFVNLKSKVALGELGTFVDIDQIKLAVRGLSFRGSGGSITIGANSNLTFRNVALQSAAGHIKLDGNVQLDQGLSKGNIELVANNVNLAGLSKALALEPTLRGTGSLRAALRKAPGKRALGTVHLKFDDVRRGQEVPPTSGVLDLRLDHRDLTAKADLKTRGVGTIALNAKARGPRDPLALPGWVRLGEKALVSASVKSSPLAVAGLRHLSPEMPTAGTVTLDGELSAAGSLGSLRLATKGILHPKSVEPVNSELRVTLNGKRVELTGEAAIDKRIASTIAATVELPGPLLRASTMGRITQDNLLAARIIVDDVDLFWWDKILELGFEPEDSKANIDVVVAQGARSATATVRATQDALDAKGKPQLRTSEFIAQLEPDSIDLKVRGVLGEHETARGVIHLDQGWNLLASGDPTAFAKTKLKADIKIIGLPLALLQTVLAPQDTKTTDLPKGSLFASTVLGGTLANPTATVDAHTEGGIVAGIEFVHLRVKAKYSEHHLVATVASAQKAGGTLHADADVRLGPSPQVRTSLEAADWDLAFLKSVLPNRSISGLLSAKANIAGPIDSLVVAGTAHVREGSFHPGAPLYAIRNLDVELALTPTKLTIEGKGNSGRGALSIDGSIAMKDLAPTSMNLGLALARVPVEAGPLSVFIDSKTTLRGKSTGPDWRFDIDIGNTIIKVPGGLSRELHPDSLPGDIVFVDSIEAPPALVAAITSSPASVIDVYIRAPETIAVRGEPVGTVVDVDLHARIGRSLLLEGTIATRGGWIELFGRRYDLRRGDVAFGGSVDPSLDIALSHDFSASTLTVAVTGTGSAPELSLRSNPPRYDDAELLSFVLGASPDDDSSKEQSTAGRATGVASSYLAGQLQSVVRDVIPIDVLKIDISDDDAAAEKLTVGKWLTDKIFLAYRRRFEAQDLENANEAVMEYRFRKRWLLELSYGDQGTGGADVLWIRRF
tara:strand:+ start:20145 stop:24614 length:4470 start_codon:yes stop_codon:yes gene_type:complete